MYWRIRKIGPEQVAKQYGVHACLIVSVIVNVAMFSKAAASKAAVPKDQKQNIENFAKQVTGHVFDANYLTVEDSMMSLLKGELHPSVVAALRQGGDLPGTQDEMKAIQRQLREKTSVSSIKYESVEVQQPDQRGYVPVEVKMQVVVHDAEGLNGPKNLRLKYVIGFASKKDDPGNVVPIVLSMKTEQNTASGATSP